MRVVTQSFLAGCQCQAQSAYSCFGFTTACAAEALLLPGVRWRTRGSKTGQSAPSAFAILGNLFLSLPLTVTSVFLLVHSTGRLLVLLSDGAAGAGAAVGTASVAGAGGAGGGGVLGTLPSATAEDAFCHVDFTSPLASVADHRMAAYLDALRSS